MGRILKETCAFKMSKIEIGKFYFWMSGFSVFDFKLEIKRMHLSLILHQLLGTAKYFVPGMLREK